VVYVKWLDCGTNLRLGGATRGKWRILDGNVEERFVVMFRAPKVVASA
jgi:hypothetical protein